MIKSGYRVRPFVPEASLELRRGYRVQLLLLPEESLCDRRGLRPAVEGDVGKREWTKQQEPVYTVKRTVTSTRAHFPACTLFCSSSNRGSGHHGGHRHGKPTEQHPHCVLVNCTTFLCHGLTSVNTTRPRINSRQKRNKRARSKRVVGDGYTYQLCQDYSHQRTRPRCSHPRYG